MFFKTQIDKKIENNLPNHGPTKKSVYDNYVKVGQISLYNEMEMFFYYGSIGYMC